MSLAKQPPLGLVQVEDRVVPTTGLAWPDARSLTLSYVPDATAISGEASNLFTYLNGQFNNDTAGWKREIARAYHTWAVNANINIGPVADGGQAMGTAGLSQGDARFGDIRVGARKLSPNDGDAIATASGFDYSDSTWVGDALVNNQIQFSKGQATGKYDLFSVMVHEAGHSLGLQHSTEAGSVMSDGYAHRTDLSYGDMTAIQDLYGYRPEDQHDAVRLNETSRTATNVTWTGARQTLNGDLIIASDLDHYKFKTLSSGESNIRIRVRTAGLSFLTPSLKVYRGSSLVGQASTTDPYSGEVLVSLGEKYKSGTTFTIRVAGNGNEVFNRGAYQLIIEQTAGDNSDPTSPAPDNGTNNTIATASAMTKSGEHGYTKAGGIIESTTDVDYYRYDLNGMNPNKVFSTTVSSLTPTTFLPKVSVFTPMGIELPSTVTMNEKGSYTVEVTGAALAGTSTVYLKVAAAEPNGTKALGSFTLTAGIRSGSITEYAAVASGTITPSTPTQYAQMTVEEARLVRFSLTSTLPVGAPATAVGVTIFDSLGKAVYSFSDVAGGTLTTGSVWLLQGSYTIAVTAKTSTGAAPTSIAYALTKRELGNPIDPIADGAGGPTGQDPVVTTGPVGTTPPLPVNDPIADPWAP